MNRYRREIDGLRALAIIPVVFFHADFPAFSGGFVGVDVFFVISGYLITSLIILELEKNSFSLLSFYERRARRILPALFVVIGVSFIVGWFLLLPNEMESLSSSILAASVFISNIYFWMGGGYFDTASNLKPLLHTWSLAIEEQYYVLVPLGMLFVYRFYKKNITKVFIIIAVISLMAAQAYVHSDSRTVFFLLPTRMWELMIGGIISLSMVYNKTLVDKVLSSKLGNELLSLTGLVMIGYSVFSFDRLTPFPSVNALIPTVGAGLIIFFSSPETISGRVLGSKLLVGVGLISYSLYLWHYPILVFAKHLLPQDDYLVNRPLFFIASFLVAFVSWKVIERPFRDKGRISAKALLASLSFALAMLLIIGAIGHVSNGFDQRKFDGLVLSEMNSFGGNGYALQGSNPVSKGHVTMLYGDSHALQIAPELDKHLTENNKPFTWLLGSACISLENIYNEYKKDNRKHCKGLYNQMLQRLNGEVEHLILAYRWDKLIKMRDGRRIGRVSESQEAQQLVISDLATLIKLTPRNTKVIIVGNVPATNLHEEGGYVKCVQKKPIANCASKFNEKEGEMYSFNQQLQLFAESFKEKVIFVNPYDALCKDSECRVREGNKLYYSDHAHLTGWGAQNVTGLILNKLN